MFSGVAKYLRDIYPSETYEITIACEKAFVGFYLDTDIFDHVIGCEFKDSVVNLKKRRQLIKQLRKETYDILIDPIGCEECTMNVCVSHFAFAHEKIGVLNLSLPVKFSRKKTNKIYHKIVKIDKKNMHLIEFYAEFFKKLGAKNAQPCLAEFKKVELDFEIPQHFFIVFPTASMSVKRWSAENFANIAKRVYEKTGLPLLVCGTQGDMEVMNEFFRVLDKKVPVVNVIGKTNIRSFIELIGRAELIITNDTSAYHIGVAKQIKTVLIAGGYTFTRYANYQYQNLGYKNPLLVFHSMKCFDCNNHCIYHNDKIFPCIENITADAAWKSIESYIGGIPYAGK